MRRKRRLLAAGAMALAVAGLAAGAAASNGTASIASTTPRGTTLAPAFG